jgi:uncharacterized Fe-S cluster-containing radical SAM superfamily protein
MHLEGVQSLSLYDALVRHEAVEKTVTRNKGEVQERKYWRFRCDRWYGGIVTADAVGCGLVCKYCWVSDAIMFKPAVVGEFYNPESIAKTLAEMAKKQGLKQLRVSGGEPTMGKRHLLQMLDNLENRQLSFILETNGILIGYDINYAKDLAKYPFVHVRVSLKGCNEKEFAMLTDAKPEGFRLQLKALENLVKAGVGCHPAVMTSFSQEKNLEQLIQQLRGISRKLGDNLETEELILYPSVKRKILSHGLRWFRAYAPNGTVEKKKERGK